MLDGMVTPLGLSVLLIIVSGCLAIQANETPKNTEHHEYQSKDYNGQIWMTENLRSVTDSSGKSIPYAIPNNDPANIRDYGLLYDYATACRVCPMGWHLPTAQEWEELLYFVGRKSGNALRDSLYWETTEQKFINKSGFSIRPAGYGNTGEFDNLFGTHAIFWSDTKVDTHFVKGFVLTMTSDSMRSAPQHPTYAFSVRCIKNERTRKKEN